MKILLASSIDPAAIKALEKDHDVVRAFNAPEEQLGELVADREGVIFRSGVMISAARVSLNSTIVSISSRSFSSIIPSASPTSISA